MMSSMPIFTPPEEPTLGSALSGEKPTPAKRNRVLLSCGPCRYSKLKCDREVPCGQCAKKGRESACEYSPRPEKKSRSKGMAARLQRLEGMVRNMVETSPLPAQEGTTTGPSTAIPPESRNGPDNMAQVVQGETTTFVGATHCMAILDDIEDLKSYFDDNEDDSGQSPDSIERGPSSLEHVMLGLAPPKSRQDLMALIPDKPMMDRLIMRYFNSHSPSQHVIHRPTFAKQYAAFCRDPSSAHIHWLALLFMIIGLGIYFSSFSSPHELEEESEIPPLERFKIYRAAAGWALLHGKYTQPGPMTLPPFMLYVEADFIISRAAQMDCYLLTSILVRLMLKMGLHRDPDKLVNVSPFNGEMRRRLWHMALQVDALVSFHMGLPSMVAGIQSDTLLPRNILDDDFGEDSIELPPARPMTDYTPMSYSIIKSSIVAMFSRIANMAHAISPPAYTQVMQMDVALEEKWKGLPPFLQLKPIEECIGESPIQVIQRFGLASMYNKSRCVLHRRFMTEQPPLLQHSYSRRTCLEAALEMLEYQYTIYTACLPGRILGQHSWFVSSLAVHDFLLAAMIIFIAIQCEAYGSASCMPTGYTPPQKSHLLAVLRRSHAIWGAISRDTPDVRKTAGVLETMLKKLDSETTAGHPSPSSELCSGDGISSFMGSTSITSNLTTTPDTSSLDTPTSGLPLSFQALPQTQSNAGLLTCTGLTMPSSDPTWMTLDNDLDWRFFDNVISGSTVGGGQSNTERSQNLPDFNQLFDSVPPWQPQ